MGGGTFGGGVSKRGQELVEEGGVGPVQEAGDLFVPAHLCMRRFHARGGGCSGAVFVLEGLVGLGSFPIPPTQYR